MTIVNFVLVLIGVLLNAAAQLCLKQGMSIIPESVKQICQFHRST